jgi:hypothetical protein
MATLLPELQAFVANAELDDFRRLRTARILMVTADQMFDAVLARSVYAAMPQRAQSLAESLLKDQVELIYHSVFGVRDEASRLARKLNLLLERVELSPASISAQLAASLALHIVDPEAPDTGNLERLFERCVAASMHNAAARICVKIASIRFDVGDLGAATLWCERATQVIKRSGISRLGADYLSLCIDLAVERGDLATARALIEVAPQHFPAFSTPRARREYLVYRTFVDQSSEGKLTSPSDVQELADAHKRGRTFGRHDDHMQDLWTALWRAGKRPQASKLLREYLLVARRELRPANFRLQSRTEEDPIWDELSRAKDGSTGASNHRQASHYAAPVLADC